MAANAAPTPRDEPEGDEALRTFIYSGPIFAAGYAAAPGDSKRIIASAGPELRQAIKVSGEERFEHMLRYCLALLHQAKGNICAFYVDDFPGCDESLMRLAQELIGRSGYVTSDFCEHVTDKYKGFWAWRAKT